MYVMLFSLAFAAIVSLVAMNSAAEAALNSTIGKTIGLLGLAAEVVSGALYLYLYGRRTLSGFRFDERSGADEIERDFRGYTQVVAWLRTFEVDELRRRQLFASSRVESWERGVLFVWGGMEKLGLLPVIVALYLQFKDATLAWPPKFTAVGGLLALAVGCFYAVGLWASMRKTQAARFERLLKLALDPNFVSNASYSTESIAAKNEADSLLPSPQPWKPFRDQA